MEKQEFGGTSGVNFDDDEGAAANLASNNQFCYVGTSATSPESNTMYFNADSVLCRETRLCDSSAEHCREGKRLILIHL